MEKGWGHGVKGALLHIVVGIPAEGGFLSSPGHDIQVMEREYMGQARKQSTASLLHPTTEMGFQPSEMSCSEDFKTL